MIRILGLTAIAASIAIIAFRVGYECARYHASPAELLEAARLRLCYHVGANP